MTRRTEGYATRHPLFDRAAEGQAAVSVPLNSSVPEHEAPRLSAQHELILMALREGPKTNLELGAICQRFSARLWELKGAGYPWLKTCVKPGVYEYRLVDAQKSAVQEGILDDGIPSR